MVEAVDKKRARLNCIGHLLTRVPCQEVPHEKPILPARVRNPEYHRNPVPHEMYVPDHYANVAAGRLSEAGAGSSLSTGQEQSDIGRHSGSSRSASCMPKDLREELKAEYTILQGQYEAFDARALTIKSWSAPLLAAGVGAGFHENSLALILATIIAAISLWLLEAIWKTFQYCYTDRIKLIEAWFRDGEQKEIPPFQIFSAWGEVWDRYYREPKALFPILAQRFVYLPYLPLSILGLAAIFVKLVK